jgi:hypothetical protein
MQYVSLGFCGLGLLLMAVGIAGRLLGTKDYGLSCTALVLGMLSAMLAALCGLIYLFLI